VRGLAGVVCDRSHRAAASYMIDRTQHPSAEVAPYLLALRNAIATWHDVALAKNVS
jgi:hypothetical protein